MILLTNKYIESIVYYTVAYNINRLILYVGNGNYSCIATS